MVCGDEAHDGSRPRTRIPARRSHERDRRALLPLRRARSRAGSTSTRGSPAATSRSAATVARPLLNSSPAPASATTTATATPRAPAPTSRRAPIAGPPTTGRSWSSASRGPSPTARARSPCCSRACAARPAAGSPTRRSACRAACSTSASIRPPPARDWLGPIQGAGSATCCACSSTSDCGRIRWRASTLSRWRCSSGAARSSASPWRASATCR